MAEALRERQSGYGGSFDLTWHEDVALLAIRCGQNRWNDYFVDNFNNALDQVLQNPGAKALVTTGEGKFFSNGLDLDWMKLVREASPASLDAFGTKTWVLLNRILTFPLPTIAAINGHAYAAGAMLALSHDYRVMTRERGWLCLNEVHIGLQFNRYMMALIKTKLPGGPVFHEAVILGTRYTAAKALEAGIINVAVDSTDQVTTESINTIRSVLPEGGYIRDSLQTSKEDAYEDLVTIVDARSRQSKL